MIIFIGKLIVKVKFFNIVFSFFIIKLFICINYKRNIDKEDVKIFGILNNPPVFHITFMLAKEKSQYNAIGKILTFRFRYLNKTDNFIQRLAGFPSYRLVNGVPSCN